MSKEKELEIQLQFLDEAEEYIGTLESALLGLANSRIDIQKMNAALRAAHSIKGGAGMMGFRALSQLAHQLEDSFKVLKTQKHSVAIDADLEGLLLAGVDCLRQIIQWDRHRHPIDPQWFHTHTHPIFEQLRQRLGDPQAEDATSVLSPDEGQEVIALLFQTEVEKCLQRLETVSTDGNLISLQEELLLLTQELGGLGEMLQLTAFSSLCESIAQSLAGGDRVEAVATLALQAWRRSQALILAGNLNHLPTAIDVKSGSLSFDPPPPRIQDDSFAGLEDEEVGNPTFDLLSSTPGDEPTRPNYPVHTPEVTTSQVTPAYAMRSPSTEAKATDFRVIDAKIDDQPANADETIENTVRVPVKQLNQLNDLFGELTIERNALDLHLKRMHSLVRLLSHRVQILDQSNMHLRTAYDRLSSYGMVPPTFPLLPGISPDSYPDAASQIDVAQFGNTFDALEMDRYSSLHLLSQEVMETIAQIREVTSDVELGLEDADQTVHELNKTARQLQTNLTQVRMRPLSDICDRFPRALRELSLQHGKTVEFKITGASTLIDRNILEALSDPLMHLLRNAFDHGIEDPETRLSQGKPEIGRIEIRASHYSNRTLITVSDDGGGIPLDKIRAKAQQIGLDETLLAAATDQDLVSLIFEPGFSTSDRVTNLSGRGVGMDVVRDNLRKVRGEIKVNTEAGLGTTFTLSVPFTLSVVRVLLVESNGMLLAFPTDAIEEMIILQPDQILRMAGNEAFNWQDTAIPLIRLHRWLTFHRHYQQESLETPPNINEPAVLMISQGEQITGIQVDRCWGEQEVAIRQVEGDLPMPSGFTNCTILGDGRVLPLVNAPDLLHWITSCERSQSSQDDLTTSALASPWSSPSALTGYWSLTPLPQSQKTTILIVDDSINVRRFLALTLEKTGYRVEQAKDGQEALEKLRAGLAVQAVICDIEMPRLDGFGFLAQIKSSPAFEQIPVAMLTSRSGDKHRQLAMSLGATAYFSKPYNEQTLLRTLEQILEPASVFS